MSFISSVTVIFQLDPPNSSAFSNQKHHHQYHTISLNNNTTNGSPKVDCFLMITEIKLQHKTILAEHIITHEIEMKKKERQKEMLTGLDGSRMDAILMGSSRSKGLECIFSINNTKPLISDHRMDRIVSEEQGNTKK